ncbi:cytochrome b/b6 domain-containing protein [Halomonas halocynthiae]|uniref:cytochrome b/b6 domain-containing protein n=1 Tax=Halomonas halocynthiae TaxID=176290 RepID=UPI00041D9D46|nr:cytochrome b/b6 domain-containing protein [Halomonas halocynthiae]
MQKIKVWDLPVRFFHWLLVAVVVVAFYTMKTEGAPFDFPIEIHAKAGYIALGLLVFRWIWGVTGTHHARFSNFIYSPANTFRYLRSMLSGQGASYAGHNPLGGLAVLALLVSLSIQVLSGLFLSDDIFFNAPLYSYVSSDISSLMRKVHTWNSNALLVLIGLHLLALLVHSLKGEKLIGAMLTGYKNLPDAADEQPGREIKRHLNLWAALPLIVFAIGLVAWLWRI